MPLYNSAKRSRTVGQLIHQNQGGGDKKQGLNPSVAVDHWGLVYRRQPKNAPNFLMMLKLNGKDGPFGRQVTKYPLANPSRGIGNDIRANAPYFNMRV